MESIGNVCIYSATKSKTLLTSKIKFSKYNSGRHVFSKFIVITTVLEINFFLKVSRFILNLSDLSCKTGCKMPNQFCEQIIGSDSCSAFYSLFLRVVFLEMQEKLQAKNSLPG